MSSGSGLELSVEDEDTMKKGVDTHDNDKENSAINRDSTQTGSPGSIFIDSETDFHLLLRATQTQNLDSSGEAPRATGMPEVVQRGVKRQGSDTPPKDTRPEKSQKCLEDTFFESSALPEEDPQSQSLSLVAPEEEETFVNAAATPQLNGDQDSWIVPETPGEVGQIEQLPDKPFKDNRENQGEKCLSGSPVGLAKSGSNDDPDALGPSSWDKDLMVPACLDVDVLPPVTDDTQPFKVPSEMALVCVTVKTSDVSKLTRFIGGLTDQKMFVQCGKASEMLNFFSKITSFYEASKRRVSDVSSLSSHSRFSSATGYSADIGSIGSTITSDSSVSSKRDRHSLCPDLAIEKHNVVSPLPKLAHKFFVNEKKAYDKVSDSTAKISVRQLHFIGEENESEKPTQVVNLDNHDVDNLQTPCPSKDVAASDQKEHEVMPKSCSSIPDESTPDIVVDTTTSESKQRLKKLFSRHTRDIMSKVASPSVHSEVLNEHNSDFPNEIKVSSRVFAKWTERSDIRYWPGKVESIKDEKYFVLFDDGFSRNLKEEDLIRIDSLKPGFKVNVSVEGDGGIFQIASIVSHPDMSKGKSSKADVSYIVEFSPADNVSQVETKLVSSSLIHLSDLQAKEIKQELGGKYTMPKMCLGDLSLDNLVSTPRRTRNSTPAKTGKTPLNRDSLRKKGGDNAETSVTEEAESSSNECVHAHVQVGKEHFSTEDEAFCSSTRKSRKKKKTDESLFGGMVFVLTQSKEQSEPFSASAMDTETEEEECLETVSPLLFNKREIRQTLETNGGCVLKEFPGSKQKIPEEIILISDKHCLTMNYLSCIVYGFKLVNFTWVLNCVATKTRLPLKSYYLAVGNSTLLGREVEQKEIGNLRNLFKDLHLLLASSKKEFIADWKPVLSRMGASTSGRSSGTLDKSLSAVDVMIGDTQVPPSLLKDARSKKIPIVSSLWVIESIINGKRVPFGGFLLHSN